MRKDENDKPCPETLGEYRDYCVSIGGEKCKAVILLDEKIKQHGRDEVVLAADSQMRNLLMPLLFD